VRKCAGLPQPPIVRHMKVQIALVAATLLGAQTVAAQETSKIAASPAEQASDADAVAKGMALYTHHCSHCHGFRMISAGSVAFDLRQFPHDQKARFVQSVTHGKNGRMPAWGDLLSLQEIDLLWAYIKTGGG
jgi:mono/diheme cytochrome c family protein